MSEPAIPRHFISDTRLSDSDIRTVSPNSDRPHPTFTSWDLLGHCETEHCSYKSSKKCCRTPGHGDEARIIVAVRARTQAFSRYR